MNEDLPPGWSHATLQECCTSVEKVDPRHEPDVFFDYIDIRGIQPASGRIEATKRLLGGEAPSRARQKVRAGDIVLSTVRTYQRKSAIVPDWLDGAIASTGFAVLRPRPGIDPRFIFHQLLSDDFVDRLSARQSGSSYPAVRDGDVRTMSVRIAPASQQRSVAAAIEEHFSRLDAVEEGITSAETKCTAMPSLMAAQLFASDWPVRRLEEVAKIGSGATPKRSEARYWSNGIIPWITSAAVNRLSIRSADEFITEVALDETSVKLWPEGTVLMAMYGEGKTRGKAAMLEIESTCNQACAAISYERSLLSGRFLRTYLNVQYEANRRAGVGRSSAELEPWPDQGHGDPCS